MSFKLSDLKKHNKDLLNLLTLHLPDMLWVKDLDGNYVYANKAICDGLLMAKDTQEPIGKGDVFFALRERELHKDKPQWHTFGELCFNSDQDVIDNDKAMKFEEYGNIKGKMLYLEVYKAPFYDENGKTIGTVGTGRDITELKKIQVDLQKSLNVLEEQRELLEFQANHDALTGLPNRVLFMDRLNQSIKYAKRYNHHLALLFIDLDNFKEINDSLGHHIGDKILIEVSKRMTAKIRKSDTLSRLGGDEFCIILNDIADIQEISNIIATGMEIFKEPFVINNTTLYVSVSVGASLYPNDGEIANELLRNADAAMYKAKHAGKNRYSFYDETMTLHAFEKIYLETELRKAFKQDELEVYYQPQVDAHNGKIIGAEALVRWNHPDMGFVYPSKFIPLAELNGMIVELDRIVMDKAFEQMSVWKEQKINPSTISLNLTIKQIEEEDFLSFLASLLSKHKIAPQDLEFEVTETQIMTNPDDSIKVLEEISALGIAIAIDDFGTGYSSLAYLKRLPISKLKIDKSFVDNLPENLEDSAIAKTIINLCRSLGIDVIAEGVESVDQKDFLVQNDCNYIQGYYYSRPLDTKTMTNYLNGDL